MFLNPFAAVPLFLSLTKNYTEVERDHIAFVASVTVFIVLLTAAIFGVSLLKWVGTSMASFRVGGGIVLLVMALAMIKAQPDQIRATATETAEAESKDSIAVVPLAIPLLAGPGAMSTVVIEMHRGSHWIHYPIVFGAILIVCVGLWYILKLAVPLGEKIGPIGLNIITRIFGLMLAAISVEIMANGLKELFPMLGG